MINKSKLALIAALAAISFASPAFAQALNKGDGTGSVSTFAYGAGGSKPTYEPGVADSPAWTVAPQHEQTVSRSSHTAAIRQNGQRVATVGVQGLYNYAGAPLGRESYPNSDGAAAAGGGSAGYNQMVLTH
jgi:hypothetical protein